MVSIFPTPKKLEVNNGVFALYNAGIYVDKTFDYRVKKAAVKLRGIISETTGNFHKFAVLTEKIVSGIVIKYNADIESQAYYCGVVPTRPQNPVVAGYTFGGWYLDPAFTEKYSFNYALDSHTTLYARLYANMDG